MDEMRALHALAKAMGVATGYKDGLGRRVVVAPETLLRVCAAHGAPLASPADAAEALRAHRAARRGDGLPPVIVAWNGSFPPLKVRARGPVRAELRLEHGTVAALDVRDGTVRAPLPLSPGYHTLTIEVAGSRRSSTTATSTVIAAPVHAWRRQGEHRSWGVGTHLAALRSARSRSLGDLRDLESLCRWLGAHGGDLVTALPLGPTFNGEWPEPSPYSPVSRLFWSELILDLGDAHAPTPTPERLDVQRADAEVRAALAGAPTPDTRHLTPELVRYARFRGAQARMGRNWRAWPDAARRGTLTDADVDGEEFRFHLVAQTLVREQLHGLRERLERDGLRLGLDLAVGVHRDGYDPWSRQSLFCDAMSVGAPPDRGFPSGQDWGFAPVLPDASRREGHAYLAASIAHPAELAGVLRVDHIMAWKRLYWIPSGLPLHQGTYVTYPADELFAVLTLESHRGRCEVAGENLGTVPRDIAEALPRHRIWGMYVAQFRASSDPRLAPPSGDDVALVGTHDTPTLAGWLAGTDIPERVRFGLLAEEDVPAVAQERRRAARRLAKRLGTNVADQRRLLAALLEWLGGSQSPLVIPWLEDLWLEDRRVNLPGTRSSDRPNWQYPMRMLLDEILSNAEIAALLDALALSRRPPTPDT